ncbi:putative feruloyl esterase [Aspergillus steynii IBT 23096]|uniref:Carboxylic ester hydrolase n=1 Tax=Aspergillus steynii IBT 23096 TaxID=1392250 RepID=A0A2I2GH74_9EURO|nr:putative feruloyl esterase [Aspergillus steynii IBT 23096]PLB52228.1 putative feruloyl esterase [Aspergillus steynii IBT 23096]
MLNHSLINHNHCSPEAIATPTVFGAEIRSLSASWVQNYTLDVPSTFNYNHGDVSLHNVNFCNITVTYTHPGHDDLITVETWLPQQWNQRLQATGGGGWNAGRFVLSEFFMAGAIGEGYAATTTDAGLGYASSPNSWALESPGNVDLYDVQNLGYVSLNDQAIIGKSLVQSFYRQNASYSYWSGCSQGGRQGLMLAQRYPHAYDGIAASAPALAFTELAATVYYPLLVKSWAGTSASPLACELEFITDEAVAACDSVDRIVDGIISDPSACNFDALSVVGKTFKCSSTGKMMNLTKPAALVANAAWSGPQTADGMSLWYGFNRGADISAFGGAPGVNTSTSSDLWFRLFVAKDPDFDSTKLGPREYERYFRRGVQEYAGLLNADSPDLTEFKNAGGKLISYHGMADESIPTKSSQHYYDRVSDAMSDAGSFYRYFESPGLGHCSGGKGGQPVTIFNSLRRWVEDGVAPDILPVNITGSDGTEHSRFLCPYPTKPFYQNGNGSHTESFKCVAANGTEAAH